MDAENLPSFGYPEFDDKFIQQLKKEIPDVVEEAIRDHDLDCLHTSDQYQTRMQKRRKRKNLDGEEELDWKLDDGEYACRIWEWWKPRVNKFPCHALALRLVVLAQLSSCSVERVFSRLTSVRSICGDNMYEDICEVRMLLQCNGDLQDLLTSLERV